MLNVHGIPVVIQTKSPVFAETDVSFYQIMPVGAFTAIKDLLHLQACHMYQEFIMEDTSLATMILETSTQIC